MRIVFMGTPEFAVPALGALVVAGHEIVAVYSQPPRRSGRGKAVTPSPVQARAEALGLPVLTPASLKNAEAQAEFARHGADVAVVAAYGLILPQAVLDAPRLGCLNIHGSILPRWRGAAPVQRAILAGDEATGVAIMQMEAGLDTGPVRAERHVAIERKSAGELSAELAALGAALVVEVLGDIRAYPPVAQPEDGVTYAAKIDKAEARLDFSGSAMAVERQVRAFNPAPGAFFEYQGERFRVLDAEVIDDVDGGPGLRRGDDVRPGTVINDALTIACGSGALVPLVVQREGKRAMTVAELLNGLAIPAGTRL